MDQQNNQVAQQPNLLVFGILALVFAESGIVGLIIAILGRKKGKEYVAQGGTLTGASKTGFILCKAALIISIVMLAVWVVVIIATAAGGCALNNIASSYSY